MGFKRFKRLVSDTYFHTCALLLIKKRFFHAARLTDTPRVLFYVSATHRVNRVNLRRCRRRGVAGVQTEVLAVLAVSADCLSRIHLKPVNVIK